MSSLFLSRIPVVVGASAAFVACGDDATAPMDTAADGLADVRPGDAEDSGPGDADDTGPDVAEIDDGSLPDGTGGLTGTALEGIGVEAGEAQVLCTAWRPGATREDALALKARVILPAYAREALSQAHLEGAAFAGVRVETSPFSAGRHGPVETAGVVGEWRLTPTTEGASLFASVRHDLGAGGVLFEEYNLSRGEGDHRPVQASEVTLAWSPAGQPDRVAVLRPCTGDPALEEAVQVVHAEDEAGWVMVLRFLRTSAGQVAAGEAPVELVGHRVLTSEQPYWPTEIMGEWANTYVAARHNWDDRTVVDAGLDLGLWHVDLRDAQPGTMPISQLRFEGLFGFAEAALELDRLVDGQTVTRRYGVTDAQAFPRIDAAHLGRVHGDACGGEAPEILAAGGGDHLVQLIVCGRGGASPTVPRMVPVFWSSDRAAIGEAFERAGQGEDGAQRFSVGGLDVSVWFRPDDHLELLVMGPGDTFVFQGYERAGPLTPSPLWEERIVAGASVERVDVQVDFTRRRVRQGVGKSQIYAPVTLEAVFGERRWQVDAWDRVYYRNSHHNWADRFTAVAADGTSIVWETDFFGGVEHRLSITGPGDEPILLPTALEAIE